MYFVDVAGTLNAIVENASAQSAIIY